MVRHELFPPLEGTLGNFIPMEPVSCQEPFDSSEYFFQIKWDGIRILAFLLNGRVELQNRKGRIRTSQYPEIQELSGRTKWKEALFDGEVVAMQGDRPSFTRIMERESSGSHRKIKKLVRDIPCTYCIFDLLYREGEDLTGAPLERRLKLLQQSMTETHPSFYINENFTAGKTLFSQIEEAGMEGIVAKEKKSLYLPGQKSSRWLKIKARRSIHVLVGGLLYKEGIMKALLVGVYRDGQQLSYAGRVGSGLSGSLKAKMEEMIAPLRREEAPFINPPSLPDVCWAEPRMVVEVEYAEWTEDLKLRSPVVKGIVKVV